MTDDLIEAVARATYDTLSKTGSYEYAARVAIRAAAPLILDIAVAWAREQRGWDLRDMEQELRERFQ